MSAILYDDALLKKIKNWVKDDSMTITGPNETKRLFEYKANITNDKPINLPLIAIRRQGPLTILNTSKRPLTFDGFRPITFNKAYMKDKSNSKLDQLNAIPIQINYQIDIYTRYYAEAEEYIRDFVFNLINYPKLKIEIPYNDSQITHIANVKINTDIDDNSDIPERLVPGEFTRKTISIYIDDAYLWNYAIKDTIKLDDNVEVELKCKLLASDAVIEKENID